MGMMDVLEAEKRRLNRATYLDEVFTKLRNEYPKHEIEEAWDRSKHTEMREKVEKMSNERLLETKKAFHITNTFNPYFYEAIHNEITKRNL